MVELISSTFLTDLFRSNGLSSTRHFTDTLEMRFLDGTAFLNNLTTKQGWLSSWIDLIPADLPEAFFSTLENNLNDYAAIHNGLTLIVPMAYMEFSKNDKTNLNKSLSS